MAKVLLAARLLFGKETAGMVLAPVNPELECAFDCVSSFNHFFCGKLSLIPHPLLVGFVAPFVLLIKSPSLASESNNSMSFLPSIAKSD